MVFWSQARSVTLVPILTQIAVMHQRASFGLEHNVIPTLHHAATLHAALHPILQYADLPSIRHAISRKHALVTTQNALKTKRSLMERAVAMEVCSALVDTAQAKTCSARHLVPAWGSPELVAATRTRKLAR
jgi:hypothetical protein